MAVEGREQVTRIGIVRVNGRPEELDGPDGRRQPSLGGTSRVSREAQARICERLGVKFPGATRPGATSALSVRAPASRTGSHGGNVEGLAITRPLMREDQTFAMHDRRVGKSLAVEDWLVVAAMAPGDVVRKCEIRPQPSSGRRGRHRGSRASCAPA